MTLVVLPSAVGMALLARPLVATLLGHGSFAGDAPVLTADVLSNFAVGLLGFSVYLFALRAFYAMHDTKTPFIINLIENALNVVLGFALVGRYGVQGLAFAYSVAYTVAAMHRCSRCRRVGCLGGRRAGRPVGRMAVASAAMGGGVWLASRARRARPAHRGARPAGRRRAGRRASSSAPWSCCGSTTREVATRFARRRIGCRPCSRSCDGGGST